MPSVLSVAETPFTARTALGRWWQRWHPDSVGSFLDWAVDGVPLLDRLAEPIRRASLTSSWMTTLAPNHPDALDQLSQLLDNTESTFDDGRVALYVCPQCSDRWWGTISTEVVFTDTLVQWRAFGSQGPRRRPELFEPSVDFTFGRAQYEDVVVGLRPRFTRHRAG